MMFVGIDYFNNYNPGQGDVKPININKDVGSENVSENFHKFYEKNNSNVFNVTCNNIVIIAKLAQSQFKNYKLLFKDTGEIELDYSWSYGRAFKGIVQKNMFKYSSNNYEIGHLKVFSEYLINQFVKDIADLDKNNYWATLDKAKLSTRAIEFVERSAQARTGLENLKALYKKKSEKEKIVQEAIDTMFSVTRAFSEISCNLSQNLVTESLQRVAKNSQVISE